ncbi:Adenylyl-sulfate kinase [Candidatus Defluviicoccus seviourii]|uniref:Adenylyl-sulfate kinase n=1 Tax=Candidatus Defluviicoccus seviourii TaxID=2565273 RepID=A0A564WFL2_9PROT|nr:Adenylyl-sulfate kinase [Candidatus Defluviicoccus seviourii]
MSIPQVAPQCEQQAKPLQPHASLKIVIVGHVDHGKSSLIGRLFHDTGSLPEGKLEAIHAMSERRGMPFEWAFLMDALQAERDQGITIDVSHIHFRTPVREYVLIDAPGHREFLKNMVTGAAQADAAVLVVDAREGMQEQTKRHSYLLHLLGIRQVIVTINKMDLVSLAQDRFQKLSKDVRHYLSELGLDLQHTQIIPVSARDGDNIVTRSIRMDWYEGPTLAESLDGVQQPVSVLEMPLRFPVQDVYKFDERRIVAGRIETGQIRLGDTLMFSPSNKTARVASIEAWNARIKPVAARAGQSIGITLDEQLFIERGEVASLVANPPTLSNVFRGRLFWLGHAPLKVGKRYKMKLCTAEYTVEVQAIERIIDVNDLGMRESQEVERNAVAEVVLRARGLIALDPFDYNMSTGRFVLVEDYDIVGGGLISMEGYADQRPTGIKSSNIFMVEHRVPEPDRWRMNGHRGGILWMTGLSGAGKSTLAFSLEHYLFQRGYQVSVLDGDNVRHGLCSDLGFSPEDRVENIRRVGHAAVLFARAGFLVITAFISPYRADRDRVRMLAPGLFHEIFIEADLETCEQRDPKGLYAKARRGEIDEFTGISAPYEPPKLAELQVDTKAHSIEECLAKLTDYVSRTFVVTK